MLERQRKGKKTGRDGERDCEREREREREREKEREKEETVYNYLFSMLSSMTEVEDCEAFFRVTVGQLAPPPRDFTAASFVFVRCGYVAGA